MCQLFFCSVYDCLFRFFFAEICVLILHNDGIFNDCTLNVLNFFFPLIRTNRKAFEWKQKDEKKKKSFPLDAQRLAQSIFPQWKENLNNAIGKNGVYSKKYDSVVLFPKNPDCQSANGIRLKIGQHFDCPNKPYLFTFFSLKWNPFNYER
jgi:hypothetical protein